MIALCTDFENYNDDCISYLGCPMSDAVLSRVHTWD